MAPPEVLTVFVPVAGVALAGVAPDVEDLLDATALPDLVGASTLRST